ncbi:MAG: aldehyde dehydrogenase family protein, partial [Candidatus Lutibacillus vidarii]
MSAMPATSPPAPLRDELGEYAVSPALVAALSRMVVAGPRATRHTSHTPMSGAPLAEVPESSVADVAMAIDQGRAAQRSWARRPIAVRAQVMLRLHDLVLQHQGTLLDLIQLESGKARAHAFEEIADVAITARYYARTA